MTRRRLRESRERHPVGNCARAENSKGHDVRFDLGGYGGYQAIKVEMHDGQRVYVGASESRKDGQAAGY